MTTEAGLTPAGDAWLVRHRRRARRAVRRRGDRGRPGRARRGRRGGRGRRAGRAGRRRCRGVGGQYWRHRAGDDGARHHDWPTFRAAARPRVGDGDRRPGTLVHLAGVQVWHAERGTGRVHRPRRSTAPAAREVRARTVVLATGAYDRQLPFPGWTLPGVYTAGARPGAAQGARRRGGPADRRRRDRPVPAAGRDRARGGRRDGRRRVRGRPARRRSRRHPLTALRSASKLRRGRRLPAASLRRHRRALPDAARRWWRRIGDGRGDRRDASPRWTPAGASSPGTRAASSSATPSRWATGSRPSRSSPSQLGCEHVLDADGSLVAPSTTTQASTRRRRVRRGRGDGRRRRGPVARGGRDRRASAAAAAAGRAGRPRASGAAARRRDRLRAFAAALHDAFPVPRGWHELADATRRSCAAARR